MSDTRVAELTVEELKELIRGVVEEIITDLFRDPDEGLSLRPDVEKKLEESMLSYRSGEMTTRSAQHIAENLGLEW